MFDRLVVGFDGSRAAIGALEWAAEEAELRGAEVDVIACVFAPALFPVWPAGEIPVYDIDAVRADAEADLGRVLTDLARTHPHVRSEPTVVLGRAVDVLSAESKSADILVVGATGAGRIEDALLGSTAHVLARTSACPLALVPFGEPRAKMDRIVVGTDGSEHSDAALDWAVDEAVRRDAELVVVHTWFYPYGVSAFGSFEMHDRTRVDASLVLGTAVDRCRERTTVTVRGELVEDSAAPALIAEASQADLIVVGSRGRGRFRRLLFGSVARAVAEHSPCPVVIVRSTPG